MQQKNTAGDTVVITGAFSYTGKYATRLLVSRGYKIHTLTYHLARANPFGDEVHVFPYDFDHPDQLSETLRGASTLINTYWVRFPHGTSTFETAVQNTCALISAATNAGVRRIVHVSIAPTHHCNPRWATTRGKLNWSRLYSTQVSLTPFCGPL